MKQYIIGHRGSAGIAPERMLQLILDAKANGASIEQDYISPELVELTYRHNLEVNAWLA